MSDNPKKKPSKSDLAVNDLKKQIDDLTNALQRERADAVNVRRRAEEERIKMASYFKAAVIKDLLPFIDNFDRALQHVPVDNTTARDKQLEDWLKGLSGVYKQLWQALESIGLARIKTVGEVFDPRLHEAVQLEEDGKGAKEVVIEEFTPGFTLDDEVIRHAMVKVAMR